MSLTLDYWITSEDGESIRLVMASDIGTRTLVMKDLQPAPVLRFLKVLDTLKFSLCTSCLHII